MRPNSILARFIASTAAMAISTQPNLLAAPGSPSSPTPVPANAPSAAPGKDLGLTVALDESSLHAHYREHAWAEELTLELSPANAPPRRTTARIACDHPQNDEGIASVQPSLRLELDTLTILVTPSRVTAVNASAPDLVFETALSPSRPLLDQLRELVPALPFPQLYLALVADHEQAWTGAIAAVAPTAGRELQRGPAAPDVASGLVLLQSANRTAGGASDADPMAPLPGFQATYLPDRASFVEIIARDTFGTAPGTLRITCKPLDPPAPGTFTLDVSNRQRVDSLARLRPPEPEIKPGMRLPALGLVDDTLALWSADAALMAQRNPSRSPLRLAMVFYQAAENEAAKDQSQVDQAFEACLLARGLADKYLRESATRDPSRPVDALELPLPRVGVVPVAVFDIAAFGPDLVRNEALAWNELGTPGAFTSAGPSLLKRFNPTGGVSVVVIDEDQIVRGVVPWTGRTSAQRREDLDAAFRGIAPPRTPPAPPANP